MSDNKDSILDKLSQLNLTRDEAKIYLELLRNPATHLRLSVITGINRTKVYRLVENLEKKSLVGKHTDDRGTFLVAADPETLEIIITSQEAGLQKQRSILTQLIPELSTLQKNTQNIFVVRTYEGEEGFKQMCWNELKTKNEIYLLGYATIEDLIPNHYWAEKYRKLSNSAAYDICEIKNAETDPTDFTKNEKYMKYYHCRSISRKIISLDNQIAIYNNTTAIYHWREEKKVGVEIESKSYTEMMRSVFEYYWQIATKVERNK